jgi:predicted kinase
MRKIIVTRGPQGSGKSYAIEALGLVEWTLSSDTIRSVLASPFLSGDGRMIINQAVNGEVFQTIERVANERMRRGETLCIDTTGLEISDLYHWRDLAKHHRYKIAYLDMSDIPLETAHARQHGRHEIRKVPEHTLRRFHKQIVDNPIVITDPFLETLVKGDERGTHIETLRAWLDEPALDLAAYERVVHVGDIQGCYSVLVDGGPFEKGLDPKTYYVFVGDLLDRGIENGKVLRWFKENALGKPNVTLLWGNHEDHIHRWGRGLDAVSNEFAHRTLPQLVAEGLGPDDGNAICDFARDFLVYDFNGARVIANHAGLSTSPAEPWRVSLEQYSHGTGYWEDDVDAQFTQNAYGITQVHGHRNHSGVPIQATSNSFNLEDQVEFGGTLRTCTLDRDGWTTKGYRNWVFKPLGERLSEETKLTEARKKQRKKLPHWIVKGEASQVRFDPALLASMREHGGVNERPGETFPHVSSLNFSKAVFHDQAWDEVTVKSRGLFFNVETLAMVSRGYDKFFNIGEMENTTIESIAENAIFPLTTYVKLNGFLGTVGYDEKTDTLFVSSKSSADGKFAGWFREIFEDKVSPEKRERLRRYLRDTESCLTFEIIDPVNDPHIIEYKDKNIVLLDVIRRSTTFEKADYEVTREVADIFGFDVKKRGFTIHNKIQLLQWYSSVRSKMGHQVDGSPVEGFVIEGANLMTKWKAPYYAFWKQMRSHVQRTLKAMDNKQRPSSPAAGIRNQDWMSDEQKALAVEFNGWLWNQDPVEIAEAFKTGGIIAVRTLYDKTPAVAPAEGLSIG